MQPKVKIGRWRKMTETIEVLPPLSAEAEKHHRIWRSVETVKKLSDRVVGIGPFGVGLDGVLTWIPGAGAAYTLGAGAFLVAQAYRAEASARTIAKMVLLLGLDAVTGEVPLVGDAVDFFFRSHAMAATALQKDIEARHGPPPEYAADARAKKPRWKWLGRGR